MTHEGRAHEGAAHAGVSRLDVDSLTVAFTLVPRLFPRNRMFAVHEERNVRRAKRRAATLRGVIQDLGSEATVAASVSLEQKPDELRVSYVRSDVGLRRRIFLSPVEAASVAYVLEKGGRKSPWPSDPGLVNEALARLARVSLVALSESVAFLEASVESEANDEN